MNDLARSSPAAARCCTSSRPRATRSSCTGRAPARALPSISRCPASLPALAQLLARHRRGAPAFPPCAPAAARDTRPALRGRRALRLHAARLLSDLPAVPPGDRGREVLRRAGRHRLRGLPHPASRAMGPRHHRVARRVRTAAARRRPRHRAVAGRRHADAPLLRRHRDRGLAASRSRAAAAAADRARRGARQPVAGEGPARRRRVRARRARARGLPLTFRVLGSTTEPIPQSPGPAADDPRPVRGRRPAAHHRRREARRDPVSGAGAGNLCVHAVGRARLGIADRRVGAGRVPGTPRRDIPLRRAVPWNAPAAAWNDALLAAAGLRGARGAARAGARASRSRPDGSRAIRRRYLAPVARGTRAPRTSTRCRRSTPTTSTCPRAASRRRRSRCRSSTRPASIAATPRRAWN